METGVDGQTNGGDFGQYKLSTLNRLSLCQCSYFNVYFVVEPFGVGDGPLSLHVERA